MWVNLCPKIYLHVISPSGVRHGWAALHPHTVTVPRSLHAPYYAGAVSMMKRREATHVYIWALKRLDPGSPLLLNFTEQ